MSKVRQDVRDKYRMAAEEAKRNQRQGYGWCPICGEDGVSAERCPDGNTTCANGHTYKHSERRYE